MPVTVVWDDEARTILRYDFTNRWTPSDLYDVLADTRRLLAEVNTPVDLVSNYLAADVTYEGVLATLKMLPEAPPSTRRVIIVSDNPAVRAAANVFGRVNPRWRGRLLAAADLAAARSLLADRGD